MFFLVIILVFFLPDGLIPFTTGLTDMELTALAVFIASIVGFGIARGFAVKDVGCKPHPRILVHILCAGIMVATLNFIAWYFDITEPVTKIFLFAGLGVIIYGTGLYLAGEFLRKDYTAFKELTKED